MQKMCEPLETRRMFAETGIWIVYEANTPSIRLTHTGTLLIHGTSNADTISVRRKGNRIQAEVGAEALAFTASRVKRVLVEAGGDSDRVGIDRYLLKRITVYGGAGHDSIDGNAGSILVGGGGNDRLSVPAHPGFSVDTSDPNSPLSIEASYNTLLSFFGPATLRGGDGDDTLIGQSSEVMVGGRGEDEAIEHIRYIGNPPGDIDPEADFGENAIGIEKFSTWIRPINQDWALAGLE